MIAGQMAQGNPYQKQSSYTGDWRNLISQLQHGVNGVNSVANQQYQQAVQQGQAAMGSMARGSARPGMAQMAMGRQADATQGLAAGSALARSQEQAQQQSMLGSAIQGAGQMEAQVNQANQQAWMTLLGQRLGLNAQQFQALLAREQLKQQQAMLPSGFERMVKIGGDIGQMLSGGSGGGANQEGKAAGGGMPIPPIPV
jgi:hypothetical protein